MKMDKKRLGVLAAVLLCAALLLCLPHIVSNRYYIQILNMVGINFIVVMGINILLGHTGLLSLGVAAFFGIGAYSMALLTTRYGFSFWLALPATVGITALVGYLIGKPTLRLRSSYFVIATIGIGEIVQVVLLGWVGFTGGAVGIKDIPPPSLFGFPINTPKRWYYTIVIAALILFTLAEYLAHSEIGRGWRAVKGSETAAAAMGITVAKTKMSAFILSVIYAGVAGTLYAGMTGYISPYGFSGKESLAFMCMALAGGMGYAIGPITGVALLTVMREAIRAFDRYQLIVYGLLLVIIIMAIPKGIAGTIGHSLENRKYKRTMEDQANE